MIAKAHVVFRVPVTLDVPEGTSIDDANRMFLTKASDEFINGNFSKEITECIEIPELVTKN